MISKMLGAFKFSEHDRSSNFNTVNILNAQIKKTRALTQMETIEVESAVHGYHVYQSIWTSSHHRRNAGLQARREEYNAHDRYAVDLHVLQISVYQNFNYQENNVF